jgi:hypothetical protein
MNPSIIKALKFSGITVAGISALFVILEPAISWAIGDQFEVTQQITSEISFLTAPSDVTMSPTIAGITGGTANGGTQVVVYTNDSAGYNMTLTASSSAGMIGESQGGTIPALSSTTAGVPDYNFDASTIAANTARFAYTVEASTTADLDQSFLDNGTLCNTGSADVELKCWLNASTTPEMIVNRNGETTASGATTTIRFRVVVRASPVPALPEDFYTATTTLTAVTN